MWTLRPIAHAPPPPELPELLGLVMLARPQPGSVTCEQGLSGRLGRVHASTNVAKRRVFAVLVQ